MGPEKCRHNGDGETPSQASCGAQHAQFGFEIQSITGLYLNSRDPFLHERPKPGYALLNQGCFISFPGGGYRGSNSTTLAGDFFIGCALQAHFELTRTVARIYQVRVTVDETGAHVLAPGIDAIDAVGSGDRGG